MKDLFHFLISLNMLFLLSCDGKSVIVDENGCEYDPVNSCAGFSFSIVDAGSYENLVGKDGQQIHPDSIIITNTRRDTMPRYFPWQLSDGWWIIAELDPFTEITCFNQCQSDSAFTRTYYMYLGNGDTDTVDVFFPEMAQGPEVFFNGTTGNLPNDLPPEAGSGRSSFWFRKEVQ